ncbi:hypothetical protein JXR93_04190 [bacterium]|nr:hypothetical protein [bacterium]
MILNVIYTLRLPKFRLLLFSMRTILILILLLVFLEPSFEKREYFYSKNKIVALYDYSKSMNLPLNSSNSRLYQLKESFKQGLSYLNSLKNSYHIFFYKFGEELLSATEEEISNLKAESDKTNILKILTTVLEEHEISQIDSLFISSDFINTEQSIKGDEPIFDILENKKVPINIQIPRESKIKDIRISDVKHDNYSFVQNKTSIEFSVICSGYKNLHSKVFLYEDGNKIGEDSVFCGENEIVSKHKFYFKPDKTGSYVFDISIPIDKDEVLQKNNRYSFIMNVIRDKIRVVQVVGSPSWDVRFLRQYLKNHPDVDLISFFILRTLNDIALVPQNELSLMPFPTHELFSNKLNTFDLIIFQNFDYAPYHLHPYLNKIKEFIEKRGGGFVMIGGDKSFGKAGYNKTVLHDILPITIPDIQPQESYIPIESGYKITKEGIESPFFKFNLSKNGQKEILSSLPTAEGLNITEIRNDSTLLAETGLIKGKKHPLIASRQVQKGRTMAIMTDSMWKWNFHELSSITHKQLYSYFWDKTIKWLIQDPDLNLIKIVGDNKEFKPEQPITFSLQGVDYQYKPLKSGKIDYSVTSISSKNRVEKTGTITLDSEGRGDAIFSLNEEGGYKLELILSENSVVLEKRDVVILVKDDSKEYLLPEINYQFIEKMRERKNVKILYSDDSYSDMLLKKKEITSVKRVYRSIWDSWIVILIFLSLFLGEIYIKRYKLS